MTPRPVTEEQCKPTGQDGFGNTKSAGFLITQIEDAYTPYKPIKKSVGITGTKTSGFSRMVMSE